MKTIYLSKYADIDVTKYNGTHTTTYFRVRHIRGIFFQSSQSPGKVSRQILAEEAAKWSREQRAAQEVLMENIKSGGNGLTVRTVISPHNKSIYIIQNGKICRVVHVKQ